MTARGRVARRIGWWLVVVAAGGLGAAHGQAVQLDPARGVYVAGDEKLDGRLRALIVPRALPHRPELVPQPSPAVRGKVVHVFVRLESATATDRDQLARAGLKIERLSAEHGLARGWVRTSDLRRLAALAIVRSARPVERGHLRAGSVTDEGDAAARGPQARATGFDGTGVTVGVISDGVDHLASSIGTGNVPAGTAVPSGPDCSAGSGDEGTAMLELVHDLAPGATLVFSEGLSDKLAFTDSLQCLQNAGAKVIVDDVGFFDEPFFQDGMVAQAVRTVVQAGVTYVSAAGNDALTHYQGTFTGVTDPSSGDLYHNFAVGLPSPPDTFERIELGPNQAVACTLQWNDPWDASTNDYDLELWDTTNDPPTLIEASTNVQSGTQDPLEELTPLANVGHTVAHVGVRVKRVHGASRVLALFCVGVDTIQYDVPAGSIFGQPGLTEVVTAGAIDVKDAGLDAVEPFSSQGPVSVYFPGQEQRPKPDLCGFDDVSTSICPTGAECFDPFVGTSAAAPHVAGVAALLLSKDPCRTPAEVQSALRAGADDILASGFDDVSGAGRLDALRAIGTPGPCDDGNPCTADACKAGGGCTHTVVADGTSCADGDLCNGDEVCQGGTCLPGTPLVCDDNDPCTTDGCDPATGCVFTPACDDANPCTADTCDPVAGCRHAPVADGTPCPDGNVCNGAETCVAGSCTPGTPLACTDGPACTTGACSRGTGCSYLPTQGFPGVECVCAEGVDPTACPSAPAHVTARLTHACALVARAALAKGARHQRHLVASAVQTLAAGMKVTARLQRRGLVAADCGAALGAVLRDVHDRAANLRDSL